MVMESQSLVPLPDPGCTEIPLQILRVTRERRDVIEQEIFFR